MCLGGGGGWSGEGGGGGGSGALVDHRKSTLARGSRWDYTSLPFKVEIPT